MKTNLKNFNAAFPTPIVIVGAITDGKPSWFEVAWVGIGDRDVVTLSVDHAHYTCKGIDENKVLSISLIDEKMIPKADYVGKVSGHNTDKSDVFAWHAGELGAPIIDESPVSMECELMDSYVNGDVYLLICRVKNTYAEQDIVNERSKIDYSKFKPVLFEPNFNYLRTGEIIAPCLKSEYKK